MKLSLSVRIAEEFASKERACIPLRELADLAVEAGYRGLCMRASQVGAHSSKLEVELARILTEARQLETTMVTGDFAIVYNNADAPGCLRRIQPYLDLAEALDSSLIRVALKHQDDIEWARKAADEAAKRDIRLAHQCHTESLFETVAGIEQTLRAIDRPNFGLIYEPANLELCGQDYGETTLRRLAPWIFNVYFQNQFIHDKGAITLNTWTRGPVRFDLIPMDDPRGIDFARVFRALVHAGYHGPVTVHQAGEAWTAPAKTAQRTASFLRRLGEESGVHWK
ncbi:MAG: sugar phosphate isomerase/epimerase [Verrucomicrobia bacterium]|nr:sugar phosphate isomerase/epimerase [Verrucomicrobiota bacterium]